MPAMDNAVSNSIAEFNGGNESDGQVPVRHPPNEIVFQHPCWNWQDRSGSRAPDWLPEYQLTAGGSVIGEGRFYCAAPCVLDWDGDGMLDLIVGS